MEQGKQTTGILRGDIRLLRGESLLLFDPASDAYYKVSEHFAGIISYFSEDIPFEEMLEKLHDNGIETTLKELHEIGGFLRMNGLLVPRYGEIPLRREKAEEVSKKTLLLRLSTAYLFYRFPPWRPEKFLKSAGPFLASLVSPLCLTLWIIPAFLGYVLALRDLGKILEQFSDTLSWAGLVKYVFAIVIVKILHEVAHSLAAVRFNCRVRGIGLGLIFFVPRLYTDTTDSWKLPRSKRLLIDGAGIAAELIIGGIAAFFWNFLPPGVGRSTMFYIFTVSTLSTLLVNGNIFIRYDGYYIFSDLLGIENLMKRSSDCVKQTWRWYFLRLGTASMEKHKILLISYGTAAFIYRIFLYTSICILIYCSFTKVLAIMMLVLEMYSLLLYPLWQEIKTIRLLSRKSTGKAVWLMLFSLIAVISCILLLPLSWGITMPGEVVPARRVLVSVGENGYLQEDLPSKEKVVKADDVILKLESPQLEFSINKTGRILEYDKMLLTQQELDEKEFSRSRVTVKKIMTDQVVLRELQRRKENLTIKAAVSGSFIPFLPDLSAGAFLNRNTLVGEIVSEKNIIHAYAEDGQVGKIHVGQQGWAKLRDDLKDIPCRVIRIESVAAKFDASPVLQPFNGPVAVYKNEKNEFIPAQTRYRIELEIPDNMTVSSGRFVKVKLLYREQLYIYVKKFVLSFFRKEF